MQLENVHWSFQWKTSHMKLNLVHQQAQLKQTSPVKKIAIEFTVSTKIQLISNGKVETAHVINRFLFHFIFSLFDLLSLNLKVIHEARI